MPARLHINPGDKFGRYTIIKEAATINSHRRFLCRCECGTTKEVSLANLRGSHTRSCGCYMREVSSRDHQTHGGAKTRLYQIWLGMKKRCNNSKCRAYKWYGAEGVRLCPEWTIFDRFRDWALSSGYKDDLTIERKNSNGDYEPNNCEWIPLAEQMSNTRDCKPVSVNGVDFPTIAAAARHFNIPATTAYNRLRRGVSIKEAFEVAR